MNNKPSNSLQKNWQQFKLGNNQALEGIYETYYHTLLFTAFYYLKNEEQAKDIVSEVFIKLLSFSVAQRKQNLDNVNDKLEAFLKVLTKNKCLDYIKVENNRRNILNGIYTLFNRSNNTNTFFEDDFLLVLDTLPQRQKQILQLHLQGFDNNEISDQLNISYNTVRNTLSTSKNKVRQLWKVFI